MPGVILLAIAAAAAQPAETPRGFMERLYANYGQSDYSPFTHPSQVFAPRLLAAINEDSKLAQGEVGYLDGDPVCQCQDTAGLHAAITNLRLQGKDRASVDVSIDLQGYEARLATLSLVHTRQGWRIADIGSADEPSLLHAIEQSNRTIRGRK